MAATERARALVVAAALSLAACEDPGGLTIAQPQAPSDAGAGWGSEDEGGLEAGPPDSGLESDAGLDEDSGDGDGDGDGESDGDGGGALATFVAPGASWRYEANAQPVPGWSVTDFDDSAWAQGLAPLGAGFDVATPVAPGPARFRAAFEIEDPARISGLLLRLRRDDGAIAWLNGVEVFRSNLPAGVGELDAGVSALSEAIGYDAYQYYHAFPDPSALVAGTNVLAVAVHGHGNGDTDLVLDALLRGRDPSAPPERLSCRLRTVSYDGKYGSKHVGAIWIEDGQGFVRTLEVWGGVRREHLVAWVSASAENDVDATSSATRKVHGTHLASWDLRRADGTLAAPGSYRLRAEFTEANSNGNAAPGPQLSVDFDLGLGPTILTSPTSGDAARFTEFLLYSP